MKHIIAGCGWTSSCPANPHHVSNLKYATDSWSGSGAILGLVIVAIVVVLYLVFFRSPARGRSSRTD
jgi:uncharacterized membrane protein YukC